MAQTSHWRAAARALVAVLLLTLAENGRAEDVWSMAAQQFHDRRLSAGETQQALVAAGLTPDPLATDPGTVGYVLHLAGAGSASLVVYDATRQRYQQVCWLVGALASASDIDTFNPLLRDIARTIRARGLPPRIAAYTAASNAMSAEQYGDAPPAAAHPRRAGPSGRNETSAAARPSSSSANDGWYVLAARTTMLVVVLGAALVMLRIACAHREQMAMLRAAAISAHSAQRRTS
jgi:hypothetical protein